MCKHITCIIAVLHIFFAATVSDAHDPPAQADVSLTGPEKSSYQTYAPLFKAPDVFTVAKRPLLRLDHTPFTYKSDSFIHSASLKDTVPEPPEGSSVKGHYSFILFKPVEIRMPTVDDLYKDYGLNKAVKRSLRFYSSKNRKSFKERLRRSGRYIDAMTGVFAERGLPPELALLPLIESGFKTHAYSSKRASGPWQFIPATARKYGLKIDWWVDERRDPVKSTLAAADYFGDLYERFGNWNLSLAAYNAGEGRIDRAIRKVKKKSFWRIRKTGYIARETKNYVPSFIAATAIALEPERFGFYDIQYQEPLQYDLVEISTPMDLAVIAGFTGVKTSAIKELNPELRRWCTPPNAPSYMLRIPRGSKDVFLANLANTGDDELLYVEFYKVKSGDTVGKIARQLGTQIQAIIDINSLSKKALIIAGKTILVPIDKENGLNRGFGSLRPILKSRNL
jgi:membrane-bound lytic murein transglycosylase D